MDNGLDKIMFSTKSIMITDKQKDTIESLIDQLNDIDCCDFNNIEYWKLSKQDASKLINKLLDKIDELDELDYYDECC